MTNFLTSVKISQIIVLETQKIVYSNNEPPKGSGNLTKWFDKSNRMKMRISQYIIGRKRRKMAYHPVINFLEAQLWTTLEIAYGKDETQLLSTYGDQTT